MKRKSKNLQGKQGHNRDGSPRQALDEVLYREHGAAVNTGKHDTSTHSGWSHATRPRDQAVFVRRHPARGTGPSAPSGPT